jgi:hypothetical protein
MNPISTSIPTDPTHLVAEGPLAGVLRGPDAVVAAIPHLLGFHPKDSIVIVWMQARRICLTQRMDLAAVALDRERLDHSIQMVAAASCADSAIVAIYPPGQSGDPGFRRDAQESLSTALERIDVCLVDALHVQRGRWWSYLCNQACCPPEGRAVDPAVSEQVADLLADSGAEPAASREEIVGSLARLPNEVARIRPVVVAMREELEERIGVSDSSDEAKERWRDEEIEFLAPVFSGRSTMLLDDDVPPATTARTLIALGDIRIRDTLLWHLAAAGDPAACMTSLISVLRSAPSGFIAPVATCAAIGAWLSGDGVRASAAVDRALGDDDAYGLAWLVAQSLANGLPPQSWREVMASLSEYECRTGAAGPQSEEAGVISGAQAGEHPRKDVESS